MRTPEDELQALEDACLRRFPRTLESPQGPEIRIDGRTLLNFSSNDYLGLANHEELKTAFTEGIERYGTSSGASRLICGSQTPHAALEESLAEFFGKDRAVAFGTGYSTVLGSVTGMVGKGDFIIADKLCHASLIDGARLSGATLRVYPHNRLDKLESHLKWACAKATSESRILVATESVFSMDGDRCPLREIVALKDRYGALLLLDEAHAFGIIGNRGRGLAYEAGVVDRIDLLLGTLGKAVGVAGGFVVCSEGLAELLVNRARSFVYSTAPPAAQAWASQKAINLVGSQIGDDLREHLWQNIGFLREEMMDSDATPEASAIIPIILGSEQHALDKAAHLFQMGFLIPAIRYPTVARGTARLRVTVSAAHTKSQIAQLAAELTACHVST